MKTTTGVRVIKAKKNGLCVVRLPPPIHSLRLLVHPTRRRHMHVVGGRFNYVRLGCALRTKGCDNNNNNAYKKTAERKKNQTPWENVGPRTRNDTKTCVGRAVNVCPAYECNSVRLPFRNLYRPTPRVRRDNFDVITG